MRLLLLLGLLAYCGQAIGSAGDCADPEAIKAFEAGQTQLESGNLEAGLSNIERAVAIDPDLLEAHEALASIYGYLNRFTDAIRANEQLARLDPEMADAYHYEIKRLRSLAATPRAAVKALERCRTYEPGSKDAIAACEKAVSIHPGYADAHYFLGVNYIYAEDEENAKKEIAALVPLDHEGAAPVLIHTMQHLKSEWLTEEYQVELQKLYAPYTNHQIEPEVLKFTDQEINLILDAYSEQIVALQSLLDGIPKIIPAECKESVSGQLLEQLREKMLPLGIGYLYAERANCFGHQPRTYHLFDEILTRGPASKIGTGLSVGRPVYEEWRVGLIQMSEDRKYCKPICNTLLEFRISTEIKGDSYQLVARMKLLDEITDIGQCIDLHDGGRSSWDW